jgi:hypothetical protein
MQKRNILLSVPVFFSIISQLAVLHDSMYELNLLEQRLSSVIT